VKRRMTKADFIKNNRGINDGADLPEEMLSEIFDDIQAKEIRMKDEEEAIALLSIGTPSTGLVGAITNVGRDLAKEAYVTQTTGMANKTEVRHSPSSISYANVVRLGFAKNNDALATQRSVVRSIL
jgi:brefeldin A-inhibited guanine nucleotide-exchange protein